MGLGNQLNVDPLLGMLDDNGGETQTHALLCGSSAVDAGIVNSTNLFDQRGEVRSAVPDIGAYEFSNINANVIVNGETISAVQTGAQYEWFDCNTSLIVIGQTNSAFTATANGSYAMIITINGCSDTSACVDITTVGIDQNENIINIQLYPNPVYSEFVIIANTGNIQSVLFQSIDGKQLQLSGVLENNRCYFNTATLASGIYFADVNN